MTKRLEKFFRDNISLEESCITGNQINVVFKFGAFILPTKIDKDDDDKTKEEYKIYKDLLRFLNKENKEDLE